MDATNRFSAKADVYDAFRWTYDPAALDALCEQADLSGREVVADIGAGTGALTGLLASRFARVFAVEPCAEMLGQMDGLTARYSNIAPLAGSAEKTGLPAASIDLVCIGRAIHWFSPAAARAEMWRITRPPRWLAAFSVPCRDRELLSALRRLRVSELGWDVQGDKYRSGRADVPWEQYFGHRAYRRIQCHGVIKEDWPRFRGRIGSLSPAPDPRHPAYAKFEAALKEVFDRFSDDDLLSVRMATEVVFGQMN